MNLRTLMSMTTDIKDSSFPPIGHWFRLIGNTVLIAPLADANEQVSAGGIVCVNHYHKTNLKFRVLAVGPGEWRKRKTRSGRTRTLNVWDAPDVKVGDCVLTRAELDSDVVKHSFDDGTGRLIIFSHGIMASYQS